MKYIGKLITGDFEDNTMTFEIEGDIVLQSGKYEISKIEKHTPIDASNKMTKEKLTEIMYLFRDLYCQNIDISTIDEFIDDYYPNQLPQADVIKSVCKCKTHSLDADIGQEIRYCRHCTKPIKQTVL